MKTTPDTEQKPMFPIEETKTTPLTKLEQVPTASALEPAFEADEPAAGKKAKAKRAKRKQKSRKSMLALLIAAHNEELVLAQTIKSAIRAGMDPRNIYIVDDNSDDATTTIACGIVGESNVIKVERSGKGLALTKAAKHFDLVNRYKWIHIADADGAFAPRYFDIFRKALDDTYAAATGYVRSLPGGSVSQYRVFEYTIGMEIHRRFQALTSTISIIPGPTSCFRSDVFALLNFANHALTEDFDVTIQLHRQKLGKIQFIPQAIAYTQDPQTTRDFRKQITRWNRGIMQGVIRHKIGLRPQRLDAYVTYQIFQNFTFFVNYLIIVPLVAITRHSANVVAATFLMDVVLLFAVAMLVAMRSGRWDIVSSFPHIYFYRWLTLFIFLRSFVEIVLFRRFKTTKGVWGTEGRRYKQAVSI